MLRVWHIQNPPVHFSHHYDIASPKAAMRLIRALIESDDADDSVEVGSFGLEINETGDPFGWNEWHDADGRDIMEILEKVTATEMDFQKATEELCANVAKADKTSSYGYGLTKRDKNACDQLPPGGKRWKTPRELVDCFLREWHKMDMHEAIERQGTKNALER